MGAGLVGAGLLKKRLFFSKPTNLEVKFIEQLFANSVVFFFLGAFLTAASFRCNYSTQNSKLDTQILVSRSDM